MDDIHLDYLEEVADSIVRRPKGIFRIDFTNKAFNNLSKRNALPVSQFIKQYLYLIASTPDIDQYISLLLIDYRSHRDLVNEFLSGDLNVNINYGLIVDEYLTDIPESVKVIEYIQPHGICNVYLNVLKYQEAKYAVIVNKEIHLPDTPHEDKVNISAFSLADTITILNSTKVYFHSLIISIDYIMAEDNPYPIDVASDTLEAIVHSIPVAIAGIVINMPIESKVSIQDTLQYMSDLIPYPPWPITFNMDSINETIIDSWGGDDNVESVHKGLTKMLQKCCKATKPKSQQEPGENEFTLG